MNSYSEVNQFVTNDSLIKVEELKQINWYLENGYEIISHHLGSEKVPGGEFGSTHNVRNFFLFGKI